MVVRKNLKEKLNEVVKEFDLESAPMKERLKRMVKNNQTISDYSKHLPKK